MKNKAVYVTKYRFQPEDKLFFDANIWLFIYGPQEQKNTKVDIYSSAFHRILKAKSRIYIDILIVSEFINTYSRLKWNILKRLGDISETSMEKFKNFRNSPEFESVAQEIGDNTKRILKHCSRIESGFETLELDSLINEYAGGGNDFNDQVFGEICRDKGLKLVTDDGDFKSQGVPILTANYRLLS